MSIRVTGGTGGAAWLARPTGASGVRSGGGIAVRFYGSSVGASMRPLKGDRWRANEAVDILLELYRDAGLRWLALTVYTDDDRSYTCPASPDEAQEGWRPAFTQDFAW
jgi:hypothetical protein